MAPLGKNNEERVALLSRFRRAVEALLSTDRFDEDEKQNFLNECLELLKPDDNEDKNR